MIILTDWIVLVVSWRGEINMVSLNKRGIKQGEQVGVLFALWKYFIR